MARSARSAAKIAVGGGHREGRRQGGTHHGRDQEHHAEMAEGVQEQERDEGDPKGQRRKLRRHVEACDEDIAGEAHQDLKPEDGPDAHAHRPSASSPRRVMQVLEARATSRSLSS